MTRIAILASVSLCGFVPFQAARAVPYHYYRVQFTNWQEWGIPAISNRREVLYLLFDGVGTQLYSSGHDGGNYHYVADTYGAFAEFDSYALDDYGSVVFAVRRDAGGIGVYALMANEHQYRTILESSGVQESLLPLVSSMQNGQLVFGTSFYTSGENRLYYWTVGGTTVLATQQGHPGFRSVSISPTAQILASDATHELYGNRLGLHSIGSTRWQTSHLNSQGVAADITGGSDIELYRPADGTSEILVTTSGGFSQFIAPIAINNRNQVVFKARLDGNTTGIFAGPDPVNDLVVSFGQTVLGRIVSNVSIGRNAINDRGQIAILVSFAQGPAAVIVADPLAGDINMDCQVDLDDLTILLSNFGRATYDYRQGDIVQNDRVDLRDLTALLAQLGETCP